jgi:hypothetical protein
VRVTDRVVRDLGMRALFSMGGGKLRAHYCAASVVHSLTGDLLVTAAHCVKDQRAWYSIFA